MTTSWYVARDTIPLPSMALFNYNRKELNQMKVDNPTSKKRQANGKLESLPAVTPPVKTLFSQKPKEAFREMEELVQLMANRCVGPEFIAHIGDRQYPKVEWWTTLGATLGLFPVVVYSRKVDREDEVIYEARVEVRHGDTVVAAGEALCSSREPQWHQAPEYSIKSMAITRATGKAYRIPLSFLAVMAGLAPTNAEEMPSAEESFQEPKATVRQLDFLLYLAQQHYGDKEAYRRLEYHIQVKYGVSCGQELGRKQASELIEYLMSGEELINIDNQ